MAKESAADAEAPETWCGLKMLPSFTALARESRSGAGNQVQFPGVPDPAPSPKNIGFVPPLDSTRAQLSVPDRECVKTPSVSTHLFQFFWLHFLNPEDAGPRLLSVICQTFVQPHKRKGGWLLEEQFLRSIVTPCDVALVSHITPDRRGRCFPFLFIWLFCSCLRRSSPW